MLHKGIWSSSSSGFSTYNTDLYFSYLELHEIIPLNIVLGTILQLFQMLPLLIKPSHSIASSHLIDHFSRFIQETKAHYNNVKICYEFEYCPTLDFVI